MVEEGLDLRLASDLSIETSGLRLLMLVISFIKSSFYLGSYL